MHPRKNKTRFLIPWVCSALCLLHFHLGSTAGFAGEWLIDLSGIRIADYPSYDEAWAALKDQAALIAADATNLGYHSTVKPDPQTFEIYVTITDANTRLAVLSDDGVNISVADTTGSMSQSNVVNRRGTGQALPQPDQSLHPINFPFEADHTYRITLEYDNLFYQPEDGDIDGAVLLAWNGGAAEKTKIDRLQYLRSPAYWVDVSSPLYVVKGATVQFRVTPNPAGAAWPTDKPSWKLTGGPTQTSTGQDTFTVTFDSVSETKADFKVLTVEANNTKTANIVVFDLGWIALPRVMTIFGVPRNLYRYGLGEYVNLSFQTFPAGVTAAEVGGLRWSLAGPGNLEFPSGLESGKAEYCAGGFPGAVFLKLAINNGPSRGWSISTKKTVIAPTSVSFHKHADSPFRHTVNTWSCGWLARVDVLPNDVSWDQIQVREETCPAVTDGWLVPLNKPHPQGNWRRVNWNRVDRDDEVYSGQANAPYNDGTFVWQIPWTVRWDDVSGALGTPVEQRHTSDTIGKAVSIKGGESHSRVPADPTSNY